jgi:hypothetical protein
MLLITFALALASFVPVAVEAGQQSTVSAAPAVVRLDGQFQTPTGEPRTGQVTLIVSVYAGEFDSAPLWSELQQATLGADGRYAVFAGGTLPDGLPREIFVGNAAQWIGVAIQGEAEQPRVRMLSVPYAAHASNADTLGGVPVSSFVRSDGLTEAVKSTMKSEGISTSGDPESPFAGTQNFIGKFAADGNTLVNSAVFEIGGFVGINHINPPTALTLPQDGQISWTNAAGTNQRVTLLGSSGNFFSVNMLGIEKMRVTPTGVGFLHSAPASVLTLPQDQPLTWANPGGTARIGLVGNSSNGFGIQVLGVEKFRFEANGYVGVNTAAPTSLLHLVGSSATQNVDIKLENTVGHTWRIGEAVGAGKFAVHNSTMGATRLVIDDQGRVGIGTSTPTVKLDVVGDVNVSGNIGAKYQDVAEWVESYGALEPGTVVVVDYNSIDHVSPSRKAYDTSVAGAVSAQPGLILGEKGETKSMVAQSGRVKVKVDTKYGAIKPGDLLVTSPTPGHAMLSKPMKVGGQSFHRPGTLVGKALQGLATGKGEILVLLTLQ